MGASNGVTPNTIEPSVVSSANIAENVIPKNAQDLKQWDSGGLVVGEDGLARYSDGSYASAPSTATDNGDGTYTANGIMYGIGPNTTNDPDLQPMYDQIAQEKAETDANTRSTIQNIEQQYSGLISGAQSTNAKNSLGTGNALMLSGATRYAPADASSEATIAMSKGLSTISDLQAKENAAISAANTAGAKNDQKLLDQQLTIAKQARQDKQTAAAALSKTLMAASTKQQTTANTASIDSAIESEVAKGNTDPGTILSTLNGNGMDATAAQISKSLGELLTTTGAPDLKTLTGDVKNFETLKSMPGGLPSSILALPESQQLSGYIAMVHAAAKGTAIPGATISSSGTLSSPAGEPISVGVQSNGDPIPSDQNSFLASLPGGANGDEAKLIKGLATYQTNPNSVPTRQYKGVNGLTQAQAITLTEQYDPSYDSKSYSTRAAMQKNVTSGPYSQVINSANTAIQHLALLAAAANKLPGWPGGMTSEGVDLGAGRNISFFNSLANRFATAIGSNAVTNFNTSASAVGSELAKIYKGTGTASESEIQNWQSGLSPNMSNEQIQGAIKTAIDLMAGKLSTLSSNYQSTMGKQGNFSILTPQSIRTLEALGIDPSTVDPTYDPNSDPGGSHPDDLLNAAAPSNQQQTTGDTSSFFFGASE